MKNRIKILKLNPEGFSLVELMVVVSIIGVLASVAVPNFQKYQARAKQTEAKVQLSTIYTIERTFVMDQNSYTSCLYDIGFQPNGVGKSYYTTGFKDSPSTGCGPDGSSPCNKTNFSSTPICSAFPGTLQLAAKTTQWLYPASAKASGGIPDNPDTDQKTTLSTSQFKAGAVGNIYSDKTDAWYIDQDKQLQNTSNGLP